jgi:predicted neutral ceramidase superfamily lipid hydrolase
MIVHRQPASLVTPVCLRTLKILMRHTQRDNAIHAIAHINRHMTIFWSKSPKTSVLIVIHERPCSKSIPIFQKSLLIVALATTLMAATVLGSFVMYCTSRMQKGAGIAILERVFQFA